MRAVLLLQTRIVFSESAFAELVLWRVPKPVAGSTHELKYRLAYVVDGVCAVRHDNEVGKGDHRSRVRTVCLTLMTRKASTASRRPTHSLPTSDGILRGGIVKIVTLDVRAPGEAMEDFVRDRKSVV